MLYDSRFINTCLVNGVKAQVPLLGLARVARGPHDHPLHVAQPALVVAVVRICRDTIRMKQIDSGPDTGLRDSLQPTCDIHPGGAAHGPVLPHDDTLDTRG